jgi:hypothetical protein
LIAGLIAITKYLGEVDAAAKASTKDLIEMSRSGDLFQQAAATTEIMAHGQELRSIDVNENEDRASVTPLPLPSMLPRRLPDLRRRDRTRPVTTR